MLPATLFASTRWTCSKEQIYVKISNACKSIFLVSHITYAPIGFSCYLLSTVRCDLLDEFITWMLTKIEEIINIITT